MDAHLRLGSLCHLMRGHGFGNDVNVGFLSCCCNGGCENDCDYESESDCDLDQNAK